MFLQSLTAKLIGVVIAGVSVAFYLNGTMELLNAVVMVIAAFILFGALDSAGSYSALLRNVDLNVSKAQSVLDMPTMDIDGRDITPTNYDIDVENVEFSYDKRKIIDGVSVHIPQKTTTAIVGPSGSGKTLLAKTLARVLHYTQAAAQLQSRYDELQAHQSKASSIQAPVSGLFSSYVDGYETVLTPAKLEGLGPRDLEAFAQTDPTPADNVIGKLVTNAAWYYAITVPGDTVGRFDNGDSVDVFFDSLSESFPMTVYSVGEVQDNKVVVVLRSSQDDDKAEDLRQESGRVIFHSSEGIRVPKQALRITKDGERGVYVVVSQKARFRPVTILAEDDTSYLVKAAPTSEEDTRILRDGDQVVLASAELTDGKVVR